MIYTVLDIESTGFGKYSGDEILSFGFIRINSSFDILDSGVLYFYKDGFNVGKYPACTVHKLTKSFLKQFENDFDDNCKKMYALCYNSTIIGKNSENFDMPFIKSFLQRHFPTIIPLEYSKSFDLQVEVTNTYKSMTGSTKTGKLEDYVTCLGITKEELDEVYRSLPNKGESNSYHDALYDCVATLAVFKKYCIMKGLKV